MIYTKMKKSEVQKSRSKLKQRGIALITTLLISGIAAVIATRTTLEYQSSIKRTTNIVGSDQGLLYIYSVENWIIRVLNKDASRSTADFPGEDWTSSVAGLPIEGGSIAGSLTDEGARYNINNIIDGEGKVIAAEFERLVRLLELLDIPLTLADSIADWMDSDNNARQNGAEDSTYSSLDPPYRAANQKLVDVSELRLVSGMRSNYYNRLKKHLTALPVATAVNANFANAKTLMMLDEAINADMVREVILRQNKQDAFKSQGALVQFMQGFSDDANLSSRLPDTVINTQTQFFRLAVTVNYNESQTRAVSIIQRKDANQIRVVSRILGAWVDD